MKDTVEIGNFNNGVEMSDFAGCDAVSIGKLLPTFQGSLYTLNMEVASSAKTLATI
jgi:hypothetical protein